MTRGGARKGAGRPRTKAETKTANLCGVRVTRSQIDTYRHAATLSDTSLSKWVTMRLDEAATKAIVSFSRRTDSRRF